MTEEKKSKHLKVSLGYWNEVTAVLIKMAISVERKSSADTSVGYQLLSNQTENSGCNWIRISVNCNNKKSCFRKR